MSTKYTKRNGQTIGEFSMHEKSFWLAQARRETEPLYMRVFAIANSRNESNGHACFAEGELAAFLGTTDHEVNRAIRRAKKAFYLDESSCVRCLVLPSGIEGGSRAPANAPCGYHDGPQKRRKRSSRPIAHVEAERPAEAKTDAIVMPLKPQPEPVCGGCELFGRDGCMTHSPHAQQYREPVAA